MRRGLTLIAFAVASISLSAWVLIERQGAEGDENLAAKVERVMKEEAAKARFTGEIGDFVVLPLEAQGSPESRIIACGNGAVSTPVEREGTTLRADKNYRLRTLNACS